MLRQKKIVILRCLPSISYERGREQTRGRGQGAPRPACGVQCCESGSEGTADGGDGGRTAMAMGVTRGEA